MALEFTDANFQDQVLSSDKLSVIDFGAEWCGPCRAISPVIDELSKQYEGKVNIGKVDIEQNPILSTNYGITSIPAIVFVKNGQVVDKLVGAQPKANFIKKIEAEGITLDEPARKTSSGSVITYITDPWGTRLEIVERAPLGPQVQ